MLLLRERHGGAAAWAARRVEAAALSAWMAWSMAALGDGDTCGRRRGEVQAAAAAMRAGGASGCAGGAVSVRDRRTVVAARAHGGGVEVRRRREGKRRRLESGETERKKARRLRARHIYDRWALDFL